MAGRVEFDVLKVLPGNRAIVSIEGKCRVVIQPSGDTHAELVDLPTAHMLCHNAERMREKTGIWFDAIDYPTGEVLQFDNRGLSDHWMKRHRQIDGALHDGEKRRKKYNWGFLNTPKRYRVRGFRLGRLLKEPQTLPLKSPKAAAAKYRSA